MELCFNIHVRTVLGAQFTQKVFPFDTVAELKSHLVKKTRLECHKIALVFCGQELCPETAPLSSFGIQPDSTLRLVVVARSGPARNITQPSVSRVDSAVSENERSRRGCSATEDTSAKESSAGELTEHDETDKQTRLTRLAEAVYSGRHSRRQRLNSVSAGKGRDEVHGPVEVSEKTTISVEDEEEEIIQDDAQAPLESSDGPLNASDPSEMSSGMIICDLSNEFRKIRVRRRHHMPVVGRARSKPRKKTGSSSDEREGEAEPEENYMFTMPPLRRPLPPQKSRQLPLK
ncbi:unnamed protein product, partial [Mesorhabditis spiculigera]